MVTQQRGTINKTFTGKFFPGKILRKIKLGFDLKKEGRKSKQRIVKKRQKGTVQVCQPSVKIIKGKVCLEFQIAEKSLPPCVVGMSLSSLTENLMSSTHFNSKRFIFMYKERCCRISIYKKSIGSQSSLH